MMKFHRNIKCVKLKQFNNNFAFQCLVGAFRYTNLLFRVLDDEILQNIQSCVDKISGHSYYGFRMYLNILLANSTIKSSSKYDLHFLFNIFRYLNVTLKKQENLSLDSSLIT